MLLQLDNTDKKGLETLLNFAKQNRLKLSVIGSEEKDYFLPGKPLSGAELSQLIKDSRKSGSIEMEKGHKAIREHFYAD